MKKVKPLAKNWVQRMTLTYKSLKSLEPVDREYLLRRIADEEKLERIAEAKMRRKGKPRA